MKAVLDRAAARRGWACVLIVLATGVASRADEPETRTWSDASGRHKIQAKFVSVEGTSVLLKKADGSLMRIDLEKLCSADSHYVEAQRRKQADDDPFKPVAGPPAKPATRPAMPIRSNLAGVAATPTPAAAPAAAAAIAPPGPGSLPFDRQATPGAAPEVPVDWSSATMAAMPPAGPWTLDVGPAAASEEAGGARAVPVPPKLDFFEKTKGLVVNAPATHAAVGFSLDNPKPGTSRIVLCDLRSGKLLGQFKSPGTMSPLALSDAGDKVLMRWEEFGFGNSSRLELWDLGSEGLRKEWGLAPYGDMEGGDRDVKWARFLGPDRFATLGGKGKLVVWGLDPVRPLTTVSADDNCTPGISPDGRFLAFAEKGMVGVLDVAAGQVAALQSLPTQFTPWPGLGFSPSGKRLACVAGSKLYVLNTADGALLPEILLAPVAAGPNVPPVWTDEEHVLIAERTLVDVASEIKMWQYDGAESVVGDRAGVCWFLLRTMPKQPSAVVPARLPQPAAINALTQARADPDKFFVLRPGASVSIDASGIPDASRRERVVATLTSRLAQVGAKAAAGSPLVLAATVTPGKEREISYRTIGRGFRTDNFKIHPQISGLKLTYQGKPAWEASASTLPHMDFAHLGPDETLADHVKKFEQPNYDYFEQVEIPRMIPRPGPGGPMISLGSSQISPSGVR